MQLLSAPALLRLLPLIAGTLVPAVSATDSNFETYTNELGYTSVRFKEGFEPGSADYDQRIGGNDTLSILRRQESRYTEPLVGDSKIPWGCDTNIRDDVIPRLNDVCGEVGCDSGTVVEYDASYSDRGNEVGAKVNMKATGRWPSGMKDHMIEAIQAEIIQEAVEFNEKLTRGGGNGPLNPERSHRCTVSEASNFLSIVVRNEDDDGLVAQLDVEVWFTNSNGDGFICGRIAGAGSIIVGLINGIGGGIFGLVMAIGCGLSED